ncbi:MAG: AraC family transcriptional regulator [Chloroherpetonaceae bacterium]|nr:AraC family transcriptional regulator [Chloroherpetonaceae bacterium]MDW8018644.1 AraC family transcriptional regulator [Chloroherpetonaceae bacterium]MDW8465403.1 AraC family transcriptional regulator [Chloroherpetonaceae bacterium]
MRTGSCVRGDVFLPSSRPLPPIHSKQINLVLNYIRKHLCESLPIKILCKVGCMSRANLFRKFKQEVGLTPIAFINRERVRRAAELLLRTSLRVADIGYQVGFSSVSYFTRCFKKCMGITPSQYRLQLAAIS